ncbi:ubiquitin carboxyl-terminal hydrolase 50-like [Aplochiton taeniatus]
MGPTSKIHYTAREFLLEMLDKGTIQELRNWAGNTKAGTSCQSPYQSREQAKLTQEQSDNNSCDHEMETEDASSSRCRRPGVCGLTNSGNSCYMNAVLQCLCSTVPLVENLLGQKTRKERVKCEGTVAMVFVRLLDELWLGQSLTCGPEEVRSMVCSLHSQFDNYSQQDAQELLLFLLNALHDDLKKVKERSSNRGHHSRRFSGTAGESTIITHLFEGQLKYVTICMHCEHQTWSNQVFTILSLPIPSDVYKCSLEDCLSLFFQQSILTSGDQMLCRECGVRRNTTVQTSLVKPPEILVLHLKRFGFQGSNKRKLRTNVLFSLENLDLSPFLSSCATRQYSYSLYAVVNHTGDLDMGHYTALCHSALFRSWYRFDDASVSEVQDYLVQSPNTYILFYSRGAFPRPSITGL